MENRLLMANKVSYHSKLAGTTFEGRQKTISKLKGKELLRFRREPENQYDPKATAVDVYVSKKIGWAPIGYIANKNNKDISELLDKNKEASIKISDITGGGEKNYGVNVYIEHDILPKKEYKATLVKDIFGNEIYYDKVLHQYTNAKGEIYMSGSKYAKQFERPFNKEYLSKRMVESADLPASDVDRIIEMWEVNANASKSIGTAIHAAVELYGRFKGLSEALEKEYHLHTNKVLRRAVEAFYEVHPDVETARYEVFVVDHKKKRAGQIDRIEFNDDGTVTVCDLKTNADIKKDLKVYWLQLSFYAIILRANGWKVRDLKIYHYDGDRWNTIEGDVIEIDRIKLAKPGEEDTTTVTANGYKYKVIKELELHPEILVHPHIPKPLHEVNPRNIMGKEKWDEVRQKVYESTDYHCIACGVHKSEAKGHQWLEAHEFYNIDHKKGRVEIEKIIPLCHYCHNFIHSGRLSIVIDKEKTREEVVEILEHGFSILAENKLKAFPYSLELAEQLGAQTYKVKPYNIESGDIAWGDWRLVWDGKEYPPKYKTYEEWRDRWQNES